MDDAMSDRCREPSKSGAHERDHFIVATRHIPYFLRRPGIIDQGCPFYVSGSHPGMRADALNLPLHPALEFVAPGNLKQLEFDTGAASIDDENSIIHGEASMLCARPPALGAATPQRRHRALTLSGREVLNFPIPYHFRYKPTSPGIPSGKLMISA